MKKIFRSNWFRIPFYTFTFGFAIIGAFLTIAYLAILSGWTNDAGQVDPNNRYFQASYDRYDQASDLDSAAIVGLRYEAYERILLLKDHYPQNARDILNSLRNGAPEIEVLRMLDAVNIQLLEDAKYTNAAAELNQQSNVKSHSQSAFEWMNIEEWATFKNAVAKDKKVIDSVAKITGVESRLIVSCLVGEQIRLFNSDREAYKGWIKPLNVLHVESMFSFGVTGIKDHTAKRIERYLKEPDCDFYLGEQYENLLNFSSADTAIISAERYSRLTNFRNHYYSYMYTALFLKQIKHQWEKAGHGIDQRPEILVTLFNIGFNRSKPKSNPGVGGATIHIKENSYTFGAIGYQFYYSGELFDLFPFEKKKFDWNAEV